MSVSADQHASNGASLHLGKEWVWRKLRKWKTDGQSGTAESRLWWMEVEDEFEGKTVQFTGARLSEGQNFFWIDPIVARHLNKMKFKKKKSQF